MSDTIQTTTLDNGLRVITDISASVYSAGVGIWSGVGTRHEDLKNNGVAHMVEHMLFKGTKTRNALQIVEETEMRGANMNAYTGRDITSYHCHGLGEDLPLITEVLADMYQNSTLPDDEIERERGVIIQEIGMTHDTPDDLVFDHYYAQSYANQAIGASILGTTEIIETLSKETMQNHIEKFYTAENTIIAAAGQLNHNEFVSHVTDLFGALPKGKKIKTLAAQCIGGDHRTEKDLEQAHIILGFEGVSRLHPDHIKAKVLATLFGGGMSSRLFQEVREKRGLVYSTFAFNTSNQDTGQFAVYAGTGPDKLEEIIPVICDEILKLTHTLKEEELTRAKNQIKASILMGRESMMRRADQQGRYMLFHGKHFNADEIKAEIEAITLDDLQKLAKNLIQNKLTVASLGPIAKLESFEKIQGRLAA